MGSEHTFYEFCAEDGGNEIRIWLDGIPKGAKAKFNNWLQHLEATPPGQWKRPLVDTLDEHCAGLFEIRVKLSTQRFRILGAHTPDRTPTLLHCFIKPDAKVPHLDCDVAFANEAIVNANPKRRVRHDYR